MGILQGAVDGYNIEQYVPSKILTHCYSHDYLARLQNIQSWLFQDLYWQEYVKPFLSHSIKGFLWYQGNKILGGFRGLF